MMIDISLGGGVEFPPLNLEIRRVRFHLMLSGLDTLL